MKSKSGNLKPGQKVPFTKQASEVIKVSDIVLEILDARFIEESRLPEKEKEIIKQKKILIHVLNKADLIPSNQVLQTRGLSNPILISIKTKQGVSKLREKIMILAKRFYGQNQVYVGVIGYPNTGKSSLLNLLSRRGAAPTSSQPGFTKGIRKIRLAKGIILLDTPGIIPRNENLFAEDQIKHGLLGVQIPESVRNPDMIVSELMKLYPEKLEKHYEISTFGDIDILLDELGKKLRMMKKGDEVDAERVARKILKDWQTGKI
ncbi:MAG: GTPase, partial [Nanoarchaeota archaeon]